MYIFDLFRSFLPLRNPIGFGASDFVELAAAAILLLLALGRVPVTQWSGWWIKRERRCLAGFALLPIALRLLLLRSCPIPMGSGADDFSYLLLGDTLRHGRLANPQHALSPFFETVFVLQVPAYSSIYPLGQGIVLALGQALFSTPWIGILFLAGLFSMLCYWMLLAWTTPGWAVIGGLIAVMQFGPLSPWTNTYWGGALSGVAGCLVFGALPRLGRAAWWQSALPLGCGLGLQILSRPFEVIPLAISALLFLAPGWRRWLSWRIAVPVIAAVAIALAATAAQNKAVTGNFTTLPYMQSRYQYGVPTSFTFQPVPVPHRALTRQQALDYRAQSAIHGDGPDTPGAFLARWLYRWRYYRFFFLPPLYLAAAAFLTQVHARPWLWMVVTGAIFSLATNFYPYFYPHYVAAIACLCLLASVMGLERISRLRVRKLEVGRQACRFILFACAAEFLFWYGLHLLGSESVWPVSEYETADFINFGDPEGRLAVDQQLEKAPGKQLVFVRYGARHQFREWVRNGADINGSRVVWANDLGAAADEQLVAYFGDRKAWLLEPDAEPPRLTRFAPQPSISHQ